MKHRDMDPEDLLNQLLNNNANVQAILLSEAKDGKLAQLTVDCKFEVDACQTYGKEVGKHVAYYNVSWALQGEPKRKKLEMGIGVNLPMAIKVYQQLLALLSLHIATHESIRSSLTKFLVEVD